MVQFTGKGAGPPELLGCAKGHGDRTSWPASRLGCSYRRGDRAAGARTWAGPWDVVGDPEIEM